MSQKIIEWSIDGIRVLEADASGRVAQCGFWETFEHHDTSFTSQEIGQKLKDWMTGAGISSGSAILVLPREAVVVRQLQLPNAPEEEIPDLVKFQSAAKSSLAIDDLALDYLRVESGGEGLAVLTASIDRKRLQRMQQIASAAGFEVQHATITSLTAGQFAKTFGGASLGTDQPEIVVFQRHSLIELSIFDRGALVFSHSLVLPEENRLKPLESGLSRLIVSLNQTHPNVKVNRCYLLGTTADADVRGLLEKRFQDHVTQVHLPESLAGGHDTVTFETLIGAALPVAHANLKLDLLNPRKKIEKPDRKKWYWIGGSTAAALLLALSFGIFLSKKGALEQSIETLNNSIAEIDKDLDAGKPQDQAFKSIEVWMQGQKNPIVAWNELRRHMPGTDKLYMSELRLQPVSDKEVEARFTGVGFARERNDVDDLYQKLAENGFRVTPQATSNTSRDPDYPVRFEINIDVLRPAPSPKTSIEKKTRATAAAVPSESSPRS
ncbi:hypothetical protein [Thalassoglobus sp.]|uniref:hypothetical protein n=1 Tax=Thalassoglobus sp. TaxID=2795869 RepID=UPI003AA8C2F2